MLHSPLSTVSFTRFANCKQKLTMCNFLRCNSLCFPGHVNIIFIPILFSACKTKPYVGAFLWSFILFLYSSERSSVYYVAFWLSDGFATETCVESSCEPNPLSRCSSTSHLWPFCEFLSSHTSGSRSDMYCRRASQELV